jgi:hypothetical protein
MRGAGEASYKAWQMLRRKPAVEGVTGEQVPLVAFW